MPTLKSYTDDSPQSGHYILANVGGSRPITIQVTELGEQILQKAGYGGGDNVPTKVVWSMFDIGILYTSGTINDPPKTVDDPDETFRQLGIANKLSEREQVQLIRYLNEYSGPNQAEVDDLRETLEQSGDATQRDSTVPVNIRNDLNRLSTLYESGDLTLEEYELLKARVLDNSRLSDDPLSDSSESSDADSRQESFRGDLVEEFWNIVPEDKYDDSFQNIELDDQGSSDVSMINVSYSAEGGFSYYCPFYERSHEERMFELIEAGQWKLEIDQSDAGTAPSVMVRRKEGQDGYRDELSSEYVDEEVSHFLDMLQTVYRTDVGDLELVE